MNKKINKKLIAWVSVFTLMLPFLIYGLVNTLGGCLILEKKDILSYYASIGGACFGGYITAVGLYITLLQNQEDLSAQRKIDKDSRDDEKISQAIPVLKLSNNTKSNEEQNLRLDKEKGSFYLSFGIKNIGLGPAMNIKIFIANIIVKNSAILENTFDLGAGDEQNISINIFNIDKLSRNKDESELLFLQIRLEFTDVYNKNKYMYKFNGIKEKTENGFKIFEFDSKVINKIIE